MAVITISREFGSEGSAIAEKVAHNMNYHFADKNTLAAMLNEYGMVEFDHVYETLPSFWERLDFGKMEQRSMIIGMLNQCIMALAHHGDIVIVGRGGFAVLGGLADVLNVRIQAPLDLRVRRVTDQPSVAEPSRAEELVKNNDRLQKTFIDSIYKTEWESAKVFDLVIDTEKISPDMAAGWIEEAAMNLQIPAETGVRTAAKLEVDRILAASVEEFFSCELAHAG